MPAPHNHQFDPYRGRFPLTLLAFGNAGPAQRLKIAVGRRADVIAVPGNPLDDITLMQKVSFVMKDGVVYKQDGKGVM